jgi:hypothetical protein
MILFRSHNTSQMISTYICSSFVKLISYQTIYIHSCSLRLSVTYESVQVIHRCSVVSYHHMILVSLQLVRHDKNDHLCPFFLLATVMSDPRFTASDYLYPMVSSSFTEIPVSIFTFFTNNMHYTEN